MKLSKFIYVNFQIIGLFAVMHYFAFGNLVDTFPDSGILFTVYMGGAYAALIIQWLNKDNNR